MSRRRLLKAKHKDLSQEIREQITYALCEQCGGRYTQAEAKSIRPVSFMEGLEETGIECPHCGCWTHAYFMTTELRELRHRVEDLEKEWQRHGTREVGLRYMALQQRFSTTFKAVNAKLRELAGIRSPHEIAREG